jgi:hypothetical protein
MQAWLSPYVQSSMCSNVCAATSSRLAAACVVCMAVTTNGTALSKWDPGARRARGTSWQRLAEGMLQQAASVSHHHLLYAAPSLVSSALVWLIGRTRCWLNA